MSILSVNKVGAIGVRGSGTVGQSKVPVVENGTQHQDRSTAAHQPRTASSCFASVVAVFGAEFCVIRLLLRSLECSRRALQRRLFRIAAAEELCRSLTITGLADTVESKHKVGKTTGTSW